MANPNPMIPVPQVALHFVEQIQSLSSPLTDELQQLVGSLQAGLVSIVGTINDILDVWTDVPYDASHITTDGTSTPFSGQPYLTRYKVVGKMMWMNANITITITGTCHEIRVKIPAGYIPLGLSTNTGANLQRGIGVWNDASFANGGVCSAFIDPVNMWISVQRWDGTPKASYPAGPTTVTVGFMVQIPLA